MSTKFENGEHEYDYLHRRAIAGMLVVRVAREAEELNDDQAALLGIAIAVARYDKEFPEEVPSE